MKYIKKHIIKGINESNIEVQFSDMQFLDILKLVEKTFIELRLKYEKEESESGNVTFYDVYVNKKSFSLEIHKHINTSYLTYLQDDGKTPDEDQIYCKSDLINALSKMFLKKNSVFKSMKKINEGSIFITGYKKELDDIIISSLNTIKVKYTIEESDGFKWYKFLHKGKVQYVGVVMKRGVHGICSILSIKGEEVLGMSSNREELILCLSSLVRGKIDRSLFKINEKDEIEVLSFYDDSFGNVSQRIKNVLDDLHIPYKYQYEKRIIHYGFEYRGFMQIIIIENVWNVYFKNYTTKCYIQLESKKISTQRKVLYTEQDLKNCIIRLLKDKIDRSYKIMNEDLKESEKDRILNQQDYIKKYKSKKSSIEFFYNNLDKDIDSKTIESIIKDNPFLKRYTNLLRKKRDFSILKKTIETKEEELEKTDLTKENRDYLNNLKKEIDNLNKKLSQESNLNKLFDKWDNYIKKIYNGLQKGDPYIKTLLEEF